MYYICIIFTYFYADISMKKYMKLVIKIIVQVRFSSKTIKSSNEFSCKNQLS